MNKPRLEKLKALLLRKADTPEAERFSMLDWGNQTECGTTVCALGEAALSGEFAEEGLTYKWIGGALSIRRSDKQQNSSNLDTACDFFDLSVNDAMKIFMPGGDKDYGSQAMRDCAARINQVVNAL